MTNVDKVLFYGVWGTIIGACIFYSFPYMRAMTFPFVQPLGQLISDPNSVEASFLMFALSTLWAVISSLPVAILTVIFIRYVLKANTIIYCAYPSFVILILSYWDIAGIVKFYSQYSEIPVYPPELLNPLVTISVFVGIYWLFERFKINNNASKADEIDTTEI